MTSVNGRWEAGIGDPTLIGWVTVIVYFTVAIICLKAATSADSNKSEKLFWSYLTIFLIALGINKQLDLQSLLTQIGKDLAIAQGWYKDRRIFQLGFIILIGLVGVTGTAILMRTYLNANVALKIALTGCIILFVFILIRASSFHHMDILINMKFVGVRMNGILELGGLAVIGIGGYQFYQQHKRTHSPYRNNIDI